jgi:hypothetical protein
MISMLEERALEWFPTLRRRNEAARAAARTKFEICKDWSKEGSTQDQAETREWCQNALNELRSEVFPADGASSVMRLKAAVPNVAAISDLTIEDDATTTNLNTQPTDPAQDDND